MLQSHHSEVHDAGASLRVTGLRPPLVVAKATTSHVHLCGPSLSGLEGQATLVGMFVHEHPLLVASAVVISYLFIKSGGLSSVRQPPSESDPKDLRAQQREFARERYVDWYNSLPPERRNQVDKKVAKRRVEKWRKKGLL